MAGNWPSTPTPPLFLPPVRSFDTTLDGGQMPPGLDETVFAFGGSVFFFALPCEVCAPRLQQLILFSIGTGGTNGAVTIVVIEDGYRTPSSLPYRGNETNATIKWPRGGKMASVTGRTVQLEITIVGTGSRLYALRGNFSWL